MFKVAYFIMINRDAVSDKGTIDFIFEETLMHTWTLLLSLPLFVLLAETKKEVDPLTVDDDGDGFTENDGDCNDADPNIKPFGDETVTSSTMIVMDSRMTTMTACWLTLPPPTTQTTIAMAMAMRT